jgi:hypothetical protein
MKFISIVPTKYMQDALLTSDTTLVLAHLIEEGNDYWRSCLKFQKMGGKLIMDNSFYELRANMPTVDLAKKANLINADVVVLPDLPLRSNLKFMIESTIQKLREYGVKGKFMMCTFADNKNFKEDLEQFKIMNEIKDLDIIAIPYVFREEDEFKRPEFLDLIEKEVGISGIKKRIHMFGCNCIENLKKENRSWIQSIDGTMPWKCGFYKMKLPLSRELEPRRPKHYFDIQKVETDQREVIVDNLKFIKEISKSGN